MPNRKNGKAPKSSKPTPPKKEREGENILRNFVERMEKSDLRIRRAAKESAVFGKKIKLGT